MSIDYRKILLVLIGIGLALTGIFAQEARLSVSARSVKKGGHFMITVEVPGNGADVTIGGEGFKLNGEVSRGQNITIINHKKTTSITIAYDAVATREGNITVGPAAVKMGSHVITSNSVTLNGASTDDLFIIARPVSASIYSGQSVVVEYTLYSSLRGITNYSTPVIEKSNGVFSILPEDRAPKYVNISEYKGRRYYSVTLFKGIYTPVRSGEIELPVLLTNVTVDDLGSDNFFGFSFFGSAEQREVVSSPGKIRVKAFPEKNRPADFDQAVGDLAFDLEIDRKELKNNDALKLRLTVSGYGNLNYLKPPEVMLPRAFRLYPPVIVDSIRTGLPGIFGSRTFEYIALSRSGGEYTIGPFRFSYFDPETEKYVTLVTDSFQVKVDGRVVPNDSLDMFDQLDSAMVQPVATELRPAGGYNRNTYASAWFWILYLFPLLTLFPVIFFRDRLAHLWPSREERERRKSLSRAVAEIRAAMLLPPAEQSARLVEILEKYFASRFFSGATRVSHAAVSHKFSGNGSAALGEILTLWQTAESERYSPVAEDRHIPWMHIAELLKVIDRA